MQVRQLQSAFSRRWLLQIALKTDLLPKSLKTLFSLLSDFLQPLPILPRIKESRSLSCSTMIDLIYHIRGDVKCLHNGTLRQVNHEESSS